MYKSTYTYIYIHIHVCMCVYTYIYIYEYMHPWPFASRSVAFTKAFWSGCFKSGFKVFKGSGLGV